VIDHDGRPTIVDTLLTLILKMGQEAFHFTFAYKGSRQSVYDNVQPAAPQITHDTCPTIVDAPLMLIFIIGKGGYCNLFCLSRKPIMPLWLTTTYQWRDFPECMSQNRWCSVDTHSHDGAGRVLQSVLRITQANDGCMTYYNLSEVWFPRTHDQKSLTLRWRLFCHGCIHIMQSNLAQSIVHIVLAAHLAFLFTFFLITTLFFNNT